MINIDFDKQTVIVTLSRYEIESIKQNIENINAEKKLQLIDNYVLQMRLKI